MRLSNITKPEYFFYTDDGKVLRTTKDLEKYLYICTPEEYSFHVNSEKNDFSNWVLNVLLLPILADNLKNSKSLDESKITIKNFLSTSSKMEEVPEDKVFQTVDGYTLRNLHELYYYLHSCNDGSYYHHVNSIRNDFSNWINGVFKDSELAKKLSSVNTLSDSINVLRNHMIKKVFYGDFDKEKVDGTTDGKADRKIEGIVDEKLAKNDEKNMNSSLEQKETSNTISNVISNNTNNNVSSSGFREYSDEELEKYKIFSKREAVHEEMSQKMEYILATVKELKSMISDLRKIGKDALIPELMIRMLNSKIEFYNISKKEEDYKKIIGMLNDVHRELEYTAKEEQHSFADDVLKELEIKTLAMKKNV